MILQLKIYYMSFLEFACIFLLSLYVNSNGCYEISENEVFYFEAKTFLFETILITWVFSEIDADIQECTRNMYWHCRCLDIFGYHNEVALHYCLQFFFQNGRGVHKMDLRVHLLKLLLKCALHSFHSLHVHKHRCKLDRIYTGHPDTPFLMWFRLGKKCSFWFTQTITYT